MSQPGTIRIGIGGWVYPPWRGTFYPPGLPQAQELAYGPCQGNALVLDTGPAVGCDHVSDFV